MREPVVLPLRRSVLSRTSPSPYQPFAHRRKIQLPMVKIPGRKVIADGHVAALSQVSAAFW
jgi:hypothetical protein